MSGAVTRGDIEAIYRAVLGRDPENESVIQGFLDQRTDLQELISQAIASGEFAQRYPKLAVAGRPQYYELHNDTYFGAPNTLNRTRTPLDRVLLLGSCMMDDWRSVIWADGSDVQFDRLLLGLDFAIDPPELTETYDLQISQISLRSILQDKPFFDWIRAAQVDSARAEEIFEQARAKVELMFNAATGWADRFPIFFTNFVVPQRNNHGRMLARNDLRNFQYFVEELNRCLIDLIEAKDNVYLLDLNSIASSYGKRFFADDAVWLAQHGGMVSDDMWQQDAARIVPIQRMSAHYSFNTRAFIMCIWREADAMFRTLCGVDSVKMVCVDLDDTLWRGVLAESEDIDIATAVEGWPLGVAEALAYLKARGIILAIVSKNDEANVRRIWDKVYRNQLSLDNDFAIRKINWTDKATNIQEAMKEANLLPRNVVFLDDNPAERERVKAAFPDMRVIDASHYYWKRILLWSGETQVPRISSESARRTELIQQQGKREQARSELSKEDFLLSLGIDVTLHRLTGADDPRFPRSLELLNKTNQFNTTGERWTQADFADVANRGGVVVAEVKDNFSEYGLVFVCISRDDAIVQLVMSCRVIGLGVEATALSRIADAMLADHSGISARLIHTDANMPSRDIFSRCGWQQAGDGWTLDAAPTPPAHVKVAWA